MRTSLDLKWRKYFRIGELLISEALCNHSHAIHRFHLQPKGNVDYKLHQTSNTSYSHCHWKHKHSLSFTSNRNSYYAMVLRPVHYHKKQPSQWSRKVVDITPHTLYNHATCQVAMLPEFKLIKNGRIRTLEMLAVQCFTVSCQTPLTPR